MELTNWKTAYKTESFGKHNFGTKAHKFQQLIRQLKRTPTSGHLTRADVLVTQRDIEIMGDTLKAEFYYVSTCVYREAVVLAQDKGVLAAENSWL